MAGKKEIPAWSSTTPKVNLGVPIMGSRPTVIIISPRIPEINAFTIEVWPKLQIRVIPSRTRAKSSGAPNLSAALAIKGEARARQTSPNIPPKKEEVTAVPSALPPIPFFVISCPSIAVADAEGVPGILRSIAEKDPPVMPEAKRPNNRHIDVTGGRLKVMGKRRTIPRDIVRPGVEPIKSPNTTPTIIAKRFWM